MILFRQEHVKPILEGRKTETRRTGKARWKIGSIHQARTRMLDAKSCFALLEIGGLEGMALHDVQPYEVWHEGYETLEEFVGVWERINGRGSWNHNPQVWAVKFRVVEVR